MDGIHISKESQGTYPRTEECKHMTDRRFLTVFGVSVLFAGCTTLFPPCPAPGGIDTPGQTECYHLLTITQKDPELRGRVADSAVEENKRQLPWYRATFDIEDYPKHEYRLDLLNPRDKSILVKNKDYWFVSNPGTHLLQLIGDEDLPKHENPLPKSALLKKLKSME